MKRVKFCIGGFGMLAALLLAAGSAFAQSATGRVAGTITDPAAAVIVGARVTVINIETGVHSETVTGNDGAYQVLLLPIGRYTVTAEKEGFERAVTPANELEINQTLRVDLHMVLGAISQTVAVEAQAAQVETVNPTIGGTVTGATIQNLPLNGRNTMDLLNTQPGVAGGSVAGGRTDNVSYLLDGGGNNVVRSASLNFNPNPDTVAEFRVLMNNYTAEYGRSGGGIVSVVTKSGTNQAHGSLYDYLRNTDFNANNFFLNLSGQPRANLKRNQYGGTFGGPVWIPKLVHGKDKVFFFFAYQGQRQTQTSVGSLTTVFTPAEMTGDFSQASNGKPDAKIAAFLKKYPFYQGNPTLAAQAIIDPTKVNSVFQNLAKAGLVATSPTGTFVPTVSTKANYDQYTSKVDLLATPRDRVTITLGYQSSPNLNAGNYGFPLATYNLTEYVAVAYSKMVTPGLLNDFRASFNRLWQEGNNPTTQTPGPAALGIQINPDKVLGTPQIVMPTGYLSLGYNPNNSDLADNTYAYSDTMSWMKGHHTLKGGASISFAQENSLYNYDTMGEFDFSGSGTTIGSGNALADLFMGLPDSFSQYPSAISNMRQRQFSAFFQDEWKVAPRLLLTLGLRYEYSTPQKDILGRSFSILPGVQSQRFVAAPVGAVFPGDPGAPDGLYFPDKNNFAPRVGIAWDPFGNGKTSVRAGFGVFYNLLNGWSMDENNGVPPYYAGVIFSSNNGDPLANITSTPQYMTNPYGANGQPNPFPSHATLSSKDPNLLLNLADVPFGNADWFAIPHLRTPYIYQYSFSVQRQLARDLALDASYVGSSSHKLTNMMDGNPMVLGTNVRLLNFGRYPYFSDPDRGTTDNGFAALPSTIANEGRATYSGLLTSLTKRFGSTRGLGTSFFTLAYTWAHNIDNGTGSITSTSGNIPYYNHMALKGNSSLDQRQRLTFAGGWELPFAHMWASGPKRLLGGWTLLPILTLSKGTPFDILANLRENSPTQSKVSASGAGDANLVRALLTTPTVQIYDPHTTQTIPVGSSSRTGLYYFNPTSFSVPSTWNGSGYLPTPDQRTYGMPRNSIPGIGLANLDLALTKKTTLFGERLNSEFRVEAFNVFNHTEFANPNISISSSLLGQVTSVVANSSRVLQLALRIQF
jgi:hypothetical protein